MKNKAPTQNTSPTGKTCSDKNCPFHGRLSVRGRTLTGKVISDKMAKSVIVSWDRRVYVPKFERYEKRKSKICAHNPDCIDAKKGDIVMVSECRPLSKTKHFVIIKLLGKESKKEMIREESLIEDEEKKQSKIKSADEKKENPGNREPDFGGKDIKKSKKQSKDD